MTNPIEQIADKKVGSFTLLDGAMIGASKLTTETIFSVVPRVGNGNVVSGTVKTVSAVLVSAIGRKHKAAQIVASGMLIDGMEDYALSARRYIAQRMGKGTGTASDNGLQTSIAQGQDVPAF